MQETLKNKKSELKTCSLLKCIYFLTLKIEKQIVVPCDLKNICFVANAGFISSSFETLYWLTGGQGSVRG
jgi:hypothetical protein